MFEEIFGWMYDKRLHTYAKIDKAGDVPSIIKFYTPADKLAIEVLQNKTRAKIKGWLDDNEATPALLQIVPNGPLKNLVVDQLAWDIVQRNLFNDTSDGEAAKQLIVGGDKHAMDILNSIARMTKEVAQAKKEAGTACYF